MDCEIKARRKEKGMMVGKLGDDRTMGKIRHSIHYQPFIPQDLHPIYNHITRDSILAYRVGMILNTGKQCAGLGMYRFLLSRF